MGDELFTSNLLPLWLKVAWTAMVFAIVVRIVRIRGLYVRSEIVVAS